MRRDGRRQGAWLLWSSLAWLCGLAAVASGCRNVSGGGVQREAPADPDLTWERTTEPLDEVERPLGNRPAPLDPAPAPGRSGDFPADNTGVNLRDRDPQARTPLDQGNDERALNITAQIRKRVMAADGLSFTAKNIKIISADGLVTLKGPVASTEERDRILDIAQRVAGDWRIEDRIAVIRDHG